MLMEKAQRRILKKICRRQERSFMRIMESKVQEIIEEMKRDYGVVVTESDVLEDISEELMVWDKVKDNPREFFTLLDEQNVGLIKHHLLNHYQNDPASQQLWQNITLNENARQNQS